MAAIRLHPTTKKPSVYWYEPSGKKRQKTFSTRTDATKFKKIIEAELLTNKYISPFNPKDFNIQGHPYLGILLVPINDD